MGKGERGRVEREEGERRGQRERDSSPGTFKTYANLWERKNQGFPSNNQ
jgi:hypothetical protein